MSLPINVTRMDHIGVMVTDIEAAVDWYVEALGSRDRRPLGERGSRDGLGAPRARGIRIEFVQRPGLASPDGGRLGLPPPRARRRTIAPTPSNALVDRGATVVFAPSYFDRHDMDWSFVRDPFGNILEIVSYRNHPQTSLTARAAPTGAIERQPAVRTTS